MSIVFASQNGWFDLKGADMPDQPVFDFKVLNDIKGLREGIMEDTIDAFLWELFTTKPYYDNAEMKLLGTVNTPWPCFLLAGSKEFLSKNADITKTFLRLLDVSIANFWEKKSQESVQFIVNNLSYQEQDVRKWFETARFASHVASMSESMLHKCLGYLYKAGVVSEGVEVKALCDEDFVRVIE